jgi:MinD-like ATPase involved in chromosome partitioning or flagellar assembly
MKKIFLHSFRGGTGKSNIAGNMAGCLASKGKKIALIDLDIQSPGVHAIFGFREHDITKSLNDYLWDRCKITDAVCQLSEKMDLGSGEIFFVPSSIKSDDIITILREGFDFSKLNRGFTAIEDELSPDYLIVDTHPGLYEETLFSIAVADILLIILRPDEQDFQGTSVTLEVSKKLNVPNTYLIVNHVLDSVNSDVLKRDIEKKYDCKVVSLLPHTEDLLKTASSKVFYLQYPDTKFSREIEMISDKIISITEKK